MDTGRPGPRRELGGEALSLQLPFTGASFHCLLLVGLQMVRNKSHLKKINQFFSSFCSFDPHSHFTGKAHRDGYAHFTEGKVEAERHKDTGRGSVMSDSL